MSEVRENIINLILGRRAAGKSTAQVDIFIPADLVAGKTVIVVLTKENPLYDRFKGNNKVKVLVVTSVEAIVPLMEVAYNCSFYFDDARGLFGLRMDEGVMRLMIHSRQMNCDLHFCYHSFALTCKDLFRVVDCFTIFEIKDDASARKEFFTDSEIDEINEQLKNLKKYDHFLYQQ